MSSRRKKAFITGTSSGIGRCTAKFLAQKDYDLVTLNRSEESANLSKKYLAELVPAAKICSYVVDLGDLEKVDEIAAVIVKAHQTFDLVIFNAGIMFVPFEIDDHGTEKTLRVNFLSTVLLLNHLRSRIIENGRVVFLSSVAHKWANSGDLNYAKVFQEDEDFHHENGVLAYAESKLLLILLVRHLARSSPLVKYFAVHPGICATNLFDHCLPSWISKASRTLGFIRSPEEGARGVLAAAEQDNLSSGSYLSDGEAIKALIVNESELLQKSRKFLDALAKKYALNFQVF